MEQINHEKEIKTAIDSRDEEAFREILSIDNMITECFFKIVGFVKSSLSEKIHSITKVNLFILTCRKEKEL